LQIRAFFGQDRAFNRTDLETDPAINTGREINPVPICAFCIFARPFMNAGNWTSIDAIGNAFADICNDRMRHSVLLSEQIDR
jgi:hypothetical protein